MRHCKPSSIFDGAYLKKLTVKVSRQSMILLYGTFNGIKLAEKTQIKLPIFIFAGYDIRVICYVKYPDLDSNFVT